MSILAGFTGTHVPGISAALNGPELLVVLCAGAAAWMLIQRRQAATERTLPEELDQTPLYAERCGAPGRGRTTFQRLALYDQGMVLAQDRLPIFLRYSELDEAWRTQLGPWSSVQIRVADGAARQALPRSSDNVLTFASRDPDRILSILRDKGVHLRGA